MNSVSTSQVLLVYTGSGKAWLMDMEVCWSVFVFVSSFNHNTKGTDFPWGYFVTVPLTAASLDTLISSIWTVLVSITLPALRHTHVGAGTLESLRTAGLGFCGNIMGKLHDDITSGNLTHSVKCQMPPLGVGRKYFYIGECK